MNRMKKAVAFGMSIAMTVSTFGLGGLSAAASGLPTTQGHDKYVEQDVFNVIGSDTFGTKPLDSPLFNQAVGSSNITDLQVPVLAYDDSSIGLVWQKPEKYDNVKDYNVYMDGKLLGTARENLKENAAWTAQYMKSFYEYYNDPSHCDIDMVDVDIHSFRATGLSADTEYTFSVVAIDNSGKEIGTAQTISQKTTATPDIFNVVDYGAKQSEGYTSYNDEINAFIVENTKAIQSAIDACTPGGKVVIPDGTFVSGALWLKSDMTLEVDGTLWASPNSDHFEIGFHMYPFYTDTRGWGLVNATSADESQPITNVRVTGTGKLYGNGWKFGVKDTVDNDGFTSNVGDNTMAGDPEDTATWGLPRYCGGSNAKVYYQGVQSADSARKYLANLYNEDGSRKYSDEFIAGLAADAVDNKISGVDTQDLKDAYGTRSSLLIMRNCENVYVGDITIDNPSNHSVNILDSRNIATNNVKVFSYDGNNGDGLGFGCSQNVVCWNNFTDTGDDNLGFGASVGEGARDCDIQTNSEVWMFNNFLREGHGGLAAGSHTGNGIQDVLFEDTVMNHIDMAFRFKSAPTNGGFCANITMRDCAVADTNQGWTLSTGYSDPNSVSTTEAAEIGEFYNFAAYNVSVYGAIQNTINVTADTDPVNAPQKPWHTHHNLYFQDITFGNVGGNGGFKYNNGWDTLTGCENSVFYNVKTVSYNQKAIDKGTNKAWTNIKYSKDLIFQGTTLDSVNADTDLMNNAMSAPQVTDQVIQAASAENGQSVDLSWTEASDDSNSVYYGVDTYVAGNKVDAVDGLKSNSVTMTGLSAGIDYTFKVFVSDTTGNKTAIGETSIKTSGTDTTPIIDPVSSDVAISGVFYTCAQATWKSASVTDPRVRGYEIYADGVLKETIYNYQIPNYKTADTVSKQVGRLTPGKDNSIEVVAFTDAGLKYNYTKANAETLVNYDYKSPVFGSQAKLNATVNDNDVILCWDAATDDTKVGGYRVYVDGKPILGTDGKAFNPVNGAYTTKETTYTVSGLDLTKEHNFTVQAGDSWWKAEKTMGTFDKMACFNWTVKGISTQLGVKFEDQDIVTTDQDGTQVGISLDADRGVLPEGTTASIQAVTSGTIYENVKKELSDKKFMIFDISLLDQNHAKVQPDGSVRVSIAVPSGYKTDNLKVYYVADDGTLTDMNAELIDGKMVFSTNHFSYYMLVDETAVKDDNHHETSDDNNNEENNDQNIDNSNMNPDNNQAADQSKLSETASDTTKTGDRSLAWLYAAMGAMALLAVIGVGAIVKKNRGLYKDH